MLWLVPFLSPDGENFTNGCQARLADHRPGPGPVVREWWNGYSTVLDLTHPEAVGWLRES